MRSTAIIHARVIENELAVIVIHPSNSCFDVSTRGDKTNDARRAHNQAQIPEENEAMVATEEVGRGGTKFFEVVARKCVYS